MGRGTAGAVAAPKGPRVAPKASVQVFPPEAGFERGFRVWRELVCALLVFSREGTDSPAGYARVGGVPHVRLAHSTPPTRA